MATLSLCQLRLCSRSDAGKTHLTRFNASSMNLWQCIFMRSLVSTIYRSTALNLDNVHNLLVTLRPTVHILLLLPHMHQTGECIPIYHVLLSSSSVTGWTSKCCDVDVAVKQVNKAIIAMNSAGPVEAQVTRCSVACTHSIVQALRSLDMSVCEPRCQNACSPSRKLVSTGNTPLSSLSVQ